jgi:hypothetical protein
MMRDLDLTPETLDRLEQIALAVEPPFGPAETAILWAIGIADESMSDPDLEPSLGWTLSRTGSGPFPIFEGWTDRAEYQRTQCHDLEPDEPFVHEGKRRRLRK